MDKGPKNKIDSEFDKSNIKEENKEKVLMDKEELNSGDKVRLTSEKIQQLKDSGAIDGFPEIEGVVSLGGHGMISVQFGHSVRMVNEKDVERVVEKNISNTDKKSEQVDEELKRMALEKVRQKATIINIEEIAEAEARKGADAYMTEDKAGGLKKWWKHTVADGFYRQREVTRVKKEIIKTGNIYTRRVGDNPEKIAHENTMKGISDRFRADYEDNLVLSEGEERKKFLDDNDQEVVKVKNDLKNLLDNYAMGRLDDDAFNNNKRGIIDSLKKKEDIFKGADNYADNLFEIAQNAKIAYEHGAKLGELDYDLGLVIGKAKSSLKTEAHFNWVDKGIDKMKKNGVGKFISPTALSTAVGITYSVITGVNAIASTKLGQVVGGIGSLGISVGISTAFAAANESQRIADERKQHGIEMAEGGEYKVGDKRREQMAKYEYAMEKSTDLSQRLRDLMFEKDKDGNDVVKDIKEGDVKDIIACLGNIDARKSLNANKKIDLISYSNIGNVEKESTDLTILTAQAKFELEKRIKTDLKNGLPQGVNSYEEYLNNVTNTVKDSLLGGEKGINAQDKTYRKYKAWRVTKKAAITATVGIIVGSTIRELMTIGSDHVQGLFNHPSGATTETPAKHLWDIISGHQTHMGMGNSSVFNLGDHNFEFPEGLSGLQNGNAIDVIKGGHVIYSFIPEYDASGALDPDIVAKLAHDGILSTGIHNVINSTQEVTTDASGWIQNHPGETIQVHHNDVGPFMDNNTPSIPDPANPGGMLGADGNELGMHWGGPNGSGVNPNGDAVLNISHMDAIHSVHGDVSVDVPTELHNGNLMALVYLNGGSPIPVEVQPNGDIIFDHNNPIMQQVFKLDANGHMECHAKVVELVQKMGIDKNGVHLVRAISAIPGEGLDKIKDIISIHDDIVVNTIVPPVDVQNPLFVPGVSRRPLEPVTFGGKEKKKEDPIKKIDEPDVVIPVKIENEPSSNVVVGLAGPWSGEQSDEKTEKQKNLNEISQEEYDGMYDDLKMINRRIQESKGIITLEQSDFKSEYGRKRYMDLKSIGEGIPVSFNKDELEIIGRELEGLLSKSKVISKEDKARAEKERNNKIEEERRIKQIENDLRADLEMLNNKIQSSEGIINLEESSFKSEYGKNKYKILKSIGGGMPVSFNKEELQNIGNEMEKILSDVKTFIQNNEAVITKERPLSQIVEDEKYKWTGDSKFTEEEIKLLIDNKYDENSVRKLGPDTYGRYLNWIKDNATIKQSVETIKKDNEDKTSGGMTYGPAGPWSGKKNEKTAILDQYGNPIGENKEKVAILGLDGKPIGQNQEKTAILDQYGNPVEQNKEKAIILGPDGKPLEPNKESTITFIPDEYPIKTKEVEAFNKNKEKVEVKNSESENNIQIKENKEIKFEDFLKVGASFKAKSENKEYKITKLSGGWFGLNQNKIQVEVKNTYGDNNKKPTKRTLRKEDLKEKYEWYLRESRKKAK